ncbi:hypothetical protein [Acinetobacter sp. NigerLNRRAM0016]
MSDILSRVQILLDADTARFEQKMKEAPVVATKSFDKISSSAKVMAGIVATAAMAGAGALITYTNEQVKATQELQRFAYLAQSTPQEFQKMAVGAEMMGIEQDKLSDIMKDWNERSGDFLTSGAGPLVDFMEQVAVKTEKGANGAHKLAKELSDLSGPASMGLYVEKMEEANLSQDQMSFLMESMASDSTQLLPILKNNAEGMRLWGEAAEDAGIILDDKTIVAAQQMQVQSKMLDMQLQGLKNQLTSAILPALVDVADAFQTGDDKAMGMANAGDVLATSLRGVAAVAIGVYATVNLVANSMAGVTKSANDSINLANQAAENGGFFSKLPGVKLFKSGINFFTTAQVDNSGIGMAMKDNAQVIEDSANSINSLFDNTVSDAVAKLAALQGQATSTTTATTQGTQDWLDKQNKVNEAVAKAAKAQEDLKRLQEQQYQERVQIHHQYADKLHQIDLDLETETKRIRDAAFSPEMTSRYIEAAKSRADTQKELFKSEQEFELNEHKYTELQKLEAEFELNFLRISANNDLTQEMTEAQYKALAERHDRAIAWLKLEREQEAFDAGESLRTDLQNMEIRFDLERRRILENARLSQDEQTRLIQLSEAAQGEEKRQNLNDAVANWGGTFSDITNTSEQYQLDQTRFSRADESQALFDAQMALADTAAQREEIWKAHHERMRFIESSYQQDSINMHLSSAGSVTGAMSNMFETILGKSSSTYQAMFFAQRSFYLAQAGMNVWKAASDAYANEPGTVWQKMGAAALATIESGSFVSLIEAATPVGMAHEGIDNVPNEGTWLLDKGERVVDSRTNTDLKNFLSNQQNSSSNGSVSIQVNVTDSGVSTSGANTQDQKQLGQMIGNAVRNVIRQEQRQGGLLAK